MQLVHTKGHRPCMVGVKSPCDRAFLQHHSGRRRSRSAQQKQAAGESCRSSFQLQAWRRREAPLATDTITVDEMSADMLSRSADTVVRGPTAYSGGVMLQAFGWDSCDKGNWYKTLQDKVGAIKNAGFTHAWLPAPSQSVSKQGYMPGQLYNLTSSFGNKEELISLNQALRAAGVSPVCDIVINHRCADEAVDGVYNRFRDDVDHHGRKIDWGKWAITGDDPTFGGTGNPDTGEDYGPAPDLDHANPELRKALIDWMEWLHEDMGYDSWRFDFAKGYGADILGEYVQLTVGTEVLNVGEYWVDMIWNGSELDSNQDKPRQRLCDWINATGKRCMAFDFPTKGILQEACKNTQYWRLRDSTGKAPGVIGWWPKRTVTFIDNHDTGSTQRHWPFPDHLVAAGNAYMLTHPGVPCVFWDHFFTWGSELQQTIGKLIETRKRNKIVSDSKLEIKCADSDMYVAEIGGRLLIKLGPRYDMGDLLPKENDGWKVAVSGQEFCVWEKAG